jgi:hypothetical protein
MATSEAQRLANQRNGLLSTGPRTAQGRMIASQNARKHGMRAVREDVMRTAGFSFEERKRKWMGDLDRRRTGAERTAATLRVLGDPRRARFVTDRE